MGSRTLEPVRFGEHTVYVEVSDIEAGGVVAPAGDGFTDVSTGTKIAEAGETVHAVLAGISGTVLEALKDTGPAEWTIEVNLGFKGKAGVPFVAEGEANGAIKVTARWTRT